MTFHTLQDYLAAGLGKVPDRLVAEKLGVSRQAVHQFRSTHKIARVPAVVSGPRPPTPEKLALIERVRRLVGDGLTAPRIAEKLGVSPGLVWAICKSQKISLNRKRTNGWWLSLPWELSNAELAERYKLPNAHAVARMRYLLRKHGNKLPRSPQPPRKATG